MQKIKQKIKLKNITFNSPAFRKLENIQIEIAERITVIAGHNGIGKSTIIGLIANGSGNRNSTPKSYFDQSYHAHFDELFHLSEQYDYFEKISDKPSVLLEYEINGHTLHKKCNVTRHTEVDGSVRLKVVPRTVETELGVDLGIRPAGRVPMPTIYLGMSRMTPIGEHSPEAVHRKVLKKFNEADSEYIRQKFSDVIFYQDDGDKSILSHKFTASKKGSKLPSLNHDSLSISLGQDSLSSIITALASFHQLQREDPDYAGGVLVIDEIDAGFHPHAQKNLIRLIKK
jgi:energy-coupling factor transporter ATP-binding protein EcfA2